MTKRYDRPLTEGGGERFWDDLCTLNDPLSIKDMTAISLKHWIVKEISVSYLLTSS